METVTMTAILTSIGEFFTQIVTWAGDILDVIVSNPILLITCICLPVVGAVVGYVRRLLSL